MTRSERAVRASFATICAYEAVAITTGRMPTISMMCHRRWRIQAALVAVLLAHLNLMRKVAEAVDEAAAEAVADVIAELTE